MFKNVFIHARLNRPFFVRPMRTCSREQQLAGLATTPKQGEYCGSTTPVLRQKKDL
jgi:hypothetical protein